MNRKIAGLLTIILGMTAVFAQSKPAPTSDFKAILNKLESLQACSKGFVFPKTTSSNGESVVTGTVLLTGGIIGTYASYVLGKNITGQLSSIDTRLAAINDEIRRLQNQTDANLKKDKNPKSPSTSDARRKRAQTNLKNNNTVKDLKEERKVLEESQRTYGRNLLVSRIGTGLGIILMFWSMKEFYGALVVEKEPEPRNLINEDIKDLAPHDLNLLVNKLLVMNGGDIVNLRKAVESIECEK